MPSYPKKPQLTKKERTPRILAILNKIGQAMENAKANTAGAVAETVEWDVVTTLVDQFVTDMRGGYEIKENEDIPEAMLDLVHMSVSVQNASNIDDIGMIIQCCVTYLAMP